MVVTKEGPKLLWEASRTEYNTIPNARLDLLQLESVQTHQKKSTKHWKTHTRIASLKKKVPWLHLKEGGSQSLEVKYSGFRVDGTNLKMFFTWGVIYIYIYINNLLGSAPSILNPLSLIDQLQQN